RSRTSSITVGKKNPARLQAQSGTKESQSTLEHSGGMGTGYRPASWLQAAVANRIVASRRDMFQHLGEGLRVVHCEIRQDLAVERHVGLVEAAHHPRVRGSVDSGAGVDTGDPQTAEVALAFAAVAVGVLPGAVDRVLGDRVNLGASPP